MVFALSGGEQSLSIIDEVVASVVTLIFLIIYSDFFTREVSVIYLSYCTVYTNSLI